MKYKRSYNVIFVFVLAIIIVSCVLYSSLDFTQVESEGDASIVELIDKEQGQEVAETSVMKRVEFSNFATAYRHAFTYLAKSKGYKSYTYGNFMLNVKNIVNITQDVEITSEINNLNKTTFTQLETYGSGKIKANVAWQYRTENGKVTYRQSKDREGEEFNFADKEIFESSQSEFLQNWACMPTETFVGINKLAITNGTLIKNGGEYTLTFTVSDNELIKSTQVFVKSFFNNSENAKNVNPKFETATVKMTLDAYGRPKTIQYFINFYDLDLNKVGIPISGLGGAVSYSQRFYNYDQAVSVSYVK